MNINFIRARRKELGLTQQDMANALGFARKSTYCLYENGKARFLVRHLKIIADVLQCEISDLLIEE